MRLNLIAFAGIVVLAGLGVWQFQQTSSVREDLTVIQDNIDTIATSLNRAETIKLTTHVWMFRDECYSSTDFKRKAKTGDTIEWHVKPINILNGGQCFNAGQKVRIVPKTAGTSPLDPPQPEGYPKITANAKTAIASYLYNVVLVSSAGTPIKVMEDPELEIVQTMDIKKPRGR